MTKEVFEWQSDQHFSPMDVVFADHFLQGVGDQTQVLRIEIFGSNQFLEQPGPYSIVGQIPYHAAAEHFEQKSGRTSQRFDLSPAQRLSDR